MRYRAILLLLLVLLSSVGGVAHAWPPGAVVLCAAAGDQSDLVAVSDGAGGVYAAWSDPRSGNYDVYLQHLDASGEPASGYPFDGLLVGDGVGNQLGPKLALDTNGSCWLVWKDADGSVVLRRRNVPAVVAPGFVPGGEAVTPFVTAGAIAAITVSQPGIPMIAYATPNSATVKLVKSVGGPNDPQSLTLGGIDASYVGSLCIVPDGAGGAFVSWARSKPGVLDLALQHVVPGVDLIPEIAPGWPVNGGVLCDATGVQEAATIVSDGEGGVIGAWADRRSGNSDIYLGRITASGATHSNWPANGLAVCAATGTQGVPRLVRSGPGNVLVAWEDSRTVNTDIYAAGWSTTGMRDPGWPVNGGAVSSAASIQLTPVIAPSTDGSIYLAWATLQGGAAFDIAVARASSHGGSTPTPNGQLVSTAINDQVGPEIVPGTANDAIVLWQDFRDGGADLYAQRIALGTPLDAPSPRVSSAALRLWPQPTHGGVARVDFVLADDAPATLTLLDVAGRVVGDVQKLQGSGPHTRTLGGPALAPGLYLVRLEHAGRAQTARMLVVR